MNYFKKWDNPQFKVKLTFDNGEIFETTTENDNLNSSCCVNLQINESEANIMGNPLGIFTSNTVNLEIVDKTNSLIPTNNNSKYYGYMRNGVQINIYKLPNLEPFGEYFSTSWDIVREGGDYQTVNITGDDKLTYIGNMEIPELPSYIGLDVTDLLTNLFKAIGLTEENYVIDESLSLSMSFSITKGSRVREVLNSIAQSLIARITLKRDGKIYIMPAFPNAEITGEIENDEDIQNFTTSHNMANIYNKVKLNYNLISNKPAEILETLNNVELVLGLNTFSNISINKNILSYDGVYVEYDADEVSNDDKISRIDFKGYQGGISIEIESTKQEPFLCNIEIAGRTANATDSYVESTIKTTDAKVANTLSLESFVIQHESDAKAYVNKVVDYLEKISHEVVLHGLFSEEIETGIYIIINSDLIELQGKYYITEYNMLVGEGSNTSIKAIKIKG